MSAPLSQINEARTILKIHEPDLLVSMDRMVTHGQARWVHGMMKDTIRLDATSGEELVLVYLHDQDFEIFDDFFDVVAEYGYTN